MLQLWIKLQQLLSIGLRLLPTIPKLILMKTFIASVAGVLMSAAIASATSTTPISKVMDLLSGLESKIGEEKATAIKEFNELSEWCEDTAKNLEYEIKTGKT